MARPQRADARRNVQAIITAATERLAIDPEASINDIAAAAGVGRVTLYGHFENRAALVRVVSERAIAATESELTEVDLDGDPVAALGRVLETTWHLSHRFGALIVAAEHTLDGDEMQRAHGAPVARVRMLLERGRAQGRFRTDQPIDWQVTTLQAIVHAASRAVHNGAITAVEARELVRDTGLAALHR
ncbi:TetR/AcrR family transcriptional regulator [Pseudactinotalea sp.]|uniref:TetR/AcrR family transcriptional regulator n=1 Tax=Pseudactinotalea sp. TaxID=1926260 RepID=UPI003B3B9137